MTSVYRKNAESVLGSARTHWGSGPDAGPTVAMVGVGYALLAIHDLLDERLNKPTNWPELAKALSPQAARSDPEMEG
jgi:hypothetical protein